MPITQATQEGRIEREKVHSNLVMPHCDLDHYNAVLARSDVPVTTIVSVELLWVAMQVHRPSKGERPDWENAPSKAAAVWLRKVRQKKVLQEKFWSDTWPFYMENRLALELKAAAPVLPKKSKKPGAANRTDDDMQTAIEGMTVPRHV